MRAAASVEGVGWPAAWQGAFGRTTAPAGCTAARVWCCGLCEGSRALPLPANPACRCRCCCCVPTSCLQGGFTERQAAHLLRSLMLFLAHMHSKGIAHLVSGAKGVRAEGANVYARIYSERTAHLVGGEEGVGDGGVWAEDVWAERVG